MYNKVNPNRKKQRIMNTFQAIQKFNYVKPNPVFVMHSRVIELDADVTAAAAAYNRQKNVGQRGGLLVKERKQEYRIFKCLDCGYVWKENIHSPMLATQSEINVYYPKTMKCTHLNT